MSRPAKPAAGPAPAKKAARALERATGRKPSKAKPRPAKKPPPEVSTVEATRAELEALKVSSADSAIAAAAIALAKDIDEPVSSAAERASCARALLALMTRIRMLAPPQKTGDIVDRVGQKHARRRARLRAVP